LILQSRIDNNETPGEGDDESLNEEDESIGSTPDGDQDTNVNLVEA
jgi:hypothetical protein